MFQSDFLVGDGLHRVVNGSLADLLGVTDDGGEAEFIGNFLPGSELITELLRLHGRVESQQGKKRQEEKSNASHGFTVHEKTPRVKGSKGN